MRAASVAFALVLAGCASMPTAKVFNDTMWISDSALSTYARVQTDLVEVGPLHQGQDVAVVVAIDMAILWGLHKAYGRWPDWQGWPAIWWSSGLVKGLVTLVNLEKILAYRSGWTSALIHEGRK